jgi:hypothetical protein
MKSERFFLFLLSVLVTSSCNLPAGNIPSLPPSGNPTTVSPGGAIPLPAPETATVAVSTPAAAPTGTSTVTPSPTPSVPTAFFIMNANCRAKPDKNSDALMSFLEGESAEIVGRNEEFDNTWWYVKMPDSKYKCWVSTITADVIGSYDDIPTIPPPY